MVRLVAGIVSTVIWPAIINNATKNQRGTAVPIINTGVPLQFRPRRYLLWQAIAAERGNENPRAGPDRLLGEYP
jgi:hypothetical protein